MSKKITTWKIGNKEYPLSSLTSTQLKSAIIIADKSKMPMYIKISLREEKIKRASNKLIITLAPSLFSIIEKKYNKIFCTMNEINEINEINY